MKIWIIGRDYPVPSNNMMGSFEFEQAKLLQKRGEEISYLCCTLHPIKVTRSRGYQYWNENGISVHSYSKIFPPRIFPFYMPRLRNRCWSEFLHRVYKKMGKPDVIHVHYPAMMMIADALKEFHNLGVKIIVTEHWTKVLAKRLDHIEMNQYRQYKNIVDTFICVGNPLARVVHDTIGIKAIVIPNVVNNFFIPSDSPHDGFRFVAVGRLVKIKQFDKIIKAFADCFSGMSNVHLSIIGGGDEKEELHRLVKKLGIDDQITLTGALDRRSTAKIVANSDNLICFSRFETFGVPIIEAWACGITAIATTAAAVIDNFDERLGVEISPDDFDGLKKAMLCVYENRNNYNKEYVHQYAMNHFSEKVIGDILMENYMRDR